VGGSLRQRLTLAIVLAGCALSSTCIAATAKPDHASPISGASNHRALGLPQSGSPIDQRQIDGRGTPANGHGPGFAKHEPSNTGNHESRVPAGHEGPALENQGQDPGRNEQQGSKQDEHASGKREQDTLSREPQTPGNHEQSDAGRHGHQNRESHEAPVPGSQEQHASVGGETGSHEQGGGETGSHEQGGHEKGSHEEGAHGQLDNAGTQSARRAGTAPSTPAVSSTPLTPAPAAPIATSPVAAPPPQAPVTTPAVAAPAVAAPPAASPVATSQPTSHTSHPARRRRAGRRLASRGLARGASPVSAGVPTAAIALDPARALPVGRAHRTAHSAPAPTRPSPIVTTITRIVGVVPTAVWMLVGALLALALALALRSRLVALRARRLERQRGELLEDVGLLQAALLPIPPARLGPVATSAAYRPAEGPGAGGDFYDVFALEDGKLAVILGDLSGHGRRALPHTALVRFTLRAYLEAGLSPREAVRTAGAVLDRQLGESFATVIAATYQPRERTLVYAAAGHPPPIVIGSEPITPVTVCSSPPIGAGMRTGTRQTVVSVSGRSQVCFYTDGLTEARVGLELFGPQRLAGTLAELGPRATASALLARVADETTARPDDMAACLLSVEGDARAPTVAIEELELDYDEAGSDRAERFLLACGVGQHELAELIRSMRAVARSAGTVLIQLRITDGSPEVSLLRDNIAFLHGPHTMRQTALGASR
jgi:Stage II sporulation protein E (SpoIIE)